MASIIAHMDRVPCDALNNACFFFAYSRAIGISEIENWTYTLSYMYVLNAQLLKTVPAVGRAQVFATIKATFFTHLATIPRRPAQVKSLPVPVPRNPNIQRAALWLTLLF